MDKNGNKTIKFIIISILIITVVSLIGFAYARYVTQLNENARADVAKWHFEVKDGDEESENGINFPVTRLDNNETVESGKIAPGTYGCFQIEVDTSNTEVDLVYYIDINILNCPQNMNFYEDLQKNIPCIKRNENNTTNLHFQKFVPYNESKEAHINTIYWEWPYETGTTENLIDLKDTIDTEDSEKNVSFSILITGVQVDKEPLTISVGGTVIYNPPSNIYYWDNEYASSDQDGKVPLNNEEDFNVTNWKVLSVRGDKIEIMPDTVASGTVRLQGAQGYNNAVYLLNEACKELYKDTSKGITARSIREEDFIEAQIGTKWEDFRANYIHEDGTIYGHQSSTAKTGNYPSIYELEKYSVIDGTINWTGLGQSEQLSLIKKTDGGAKTGKETVNNLGFIRAVIKPYCFYYSTQGKPLGSFVDDKKMQVLFYAGEEYWIATRYILTTQNNYLIDFEVWSWNNRLCKKICVSR